MSYKMDWSGLITEIIIKKDLDCYEFENCWEENYNWTKLDKFVITNFRNLLIAYGEVEKERMKMKVNLEKDLNKYERNL